MNEIILYVTAGIFIISLVPFIMEVTKDNQRQKHCEKIKKIFDSIINGNYEIVEDDVRVKSYFYDWLLRQESIFKGATKEMRQLRKTLIANGKWYSLRAEISHEPPSGMVEIIIGDAFTEFFPPTHYMATWAIYSKVTDLLVLTGKDVEISKDYYVRIKNHFVNNKMITGIIQFDIYRLVA